MGQRIRSFDWHSTSMGDPADWPFELRAAVQLMLGTRHPVFIFWGPKHICFYNDAYRPSLGDEKHPAILGQCGEEAWAEIWSIVGPQIAQVMAGGEATWNEDQLVPTQRNGRIEDVYWTYSYGPIADSRAPQGVGGVLVLCNETTAKVLAEASLRSAEARWRALAENLPGGAVFVVDRGLRYVLAAGEALATAGLNASDFVGRRVAELAPPGAASTMTAHYEKALAGERFDIEHPSHGRYYVTRGLPLRDAQGLVYAVLAASCDISARRDVEERLRRTRAQLDGVLVAADVGLWTWRPSQDEVHHDLNLARLYDLPPVAASSKQHFFDRIHPDDRSTVLAAVESAMQTGHLYVREYRIVDREGRIRWLAGRGRVEPGGLVEAQQLTGFVIDISDLKKLEEGLLASDRQKDRFLAILAHELRNPLAPLLNAAKVLGSDQLDAPQLAWCGELITRQVQRMAVLLDDLLDLSGIKYGRLRLSKATVGLQQMVDAAVELVLPAIQARDQSLQVELPQPPVHVDVDLGRMAQVLSNLLSNASKFSACGGQVRLVVRRVSSPRGEAEVEIAVRDSGIGLAPADCEHIFGMFSQVDAMPSQMQSGPVGLGIGLALVKGFVELHGGRVRAESEGLGRGSCFTVVLPALPAEAGLTPMEEAACKPQALSQRVLIADDNPDAAHSLGMLLEMAGHEAQVVSSGVAALSACSHFRPHVAVIDIAMPGLDGYEVARRLRADTAQAGLMLVALTGWGFEAHREQAREAGFDHYFTKPIDPQALVGLLAARANEAA